MSWITLRPRCPIALVLLLVCAARATTAAEAPTRPLPGEVKVPEGFEATLFAAPPLVNYPVFVAAAPGGDVYVSVDRNGSIDRQPHRGSVVRLRDRDGDGRADERTVFVPDVDSPRGLVWDRDRLYLMHPPDLSAFLDTDGDGVADEERILVKGIAFGFQDRPADHTSNGVTLGVDGWLYLAIGDFGFLRAEGTDGRTLQLRGGGVVRVRPDGTGLEIYSRGTRNILEVAVDPLLNAFARDNTNDGGGWDIRLHHFTGLDHHGYPSLFRNFADEVVAPLADYGGGSGCGGLYLSEPGFPAGTGDALYTADWGRERIFRHRLTPRGATFAADQAEFLAIPRATDLDVDALSRLYVASWKGATFTYAGEDVGYLVRVVPKGYTPEPLPDFARAGAAELVRLLESPSHRRRLEAQRELIRRGLDRNTTEALRRLAADRAQPLAGRVAALFALEQGLKARATGILVELAADATVREYALRALTDRAEGRADVPAGPIVAAASDPNPRVRRQAAESLARLGRVEPGETLTPLLADGDPIVAHAAVAALVSLKADAACFAVVDRPGVPAERAGAIRALQSRHDDRVVAGLVDRLARETEPARRRGLLIALCRLYFQEGPWKGESWGTRPDTSGPYYQPEPWSGTGRIARVLRAALEHAGSEEAAFLLQELSRHQIVLEGTLGTIVALADRDARLLPAAVAQLARGDTVPAGSVPLLIRVVSTAGDVAVRSQAVAALSRANTAEGFRSVLAALPELESQARSTLEYQRARRAFLAAPRLADHQRFFEAEATRRDGARSAWADAALLVIADARGGPSEARTQAARALEAGWADPGRRVQLLHAVALAGHRPSGARVLASLSDPDPAVAAAAKAAAAELRLDAGPSGRPPGRRLGAMNPEAVIAAVVTRAGDRTLGEQVFTRLNCATCHTVKADEPPRGPFLGTIAATYKRGELAEAILRPSKTIAQGFATNLFALDDGTTLSGFVVREAADAVTVRTAEGAEVPIPTAQIEERRRLDTSVMPEGLVNDLTIREFASLLDYLQAPAK